MLFPVTILFAASLLNAGAQDQAQAQALYDRTDYAGAIAVLEHAPRTAHNLELLGQCRFMQSDFKKATESLESAATLAPNDSMIYTWLGRAYGRRAETSFALTAMGLAGKTRDSFERAVKLDPHNCEAVNDLFSYYIEAPGIVGGGTDKAHNLLPLIGACDASERMFAEARIHEHLKQFNEAEARLRRAIELSPKRVGLHLDLARFLSRHGRFEESEQAFQAAEKIAPSSPRILFTRAEVYIETRRNLDEARKLLKQYLEAASLTPEDPSRAEALRLLKKAEGN